MRKSQFNGYRRVKIGEQVRIVNRKIHKSIFCNVWYSDKKLLSEGVYRAIKFHEMLSPQSRRTRELIQVATRSTPKFKKVYSSVWIEKLSD